MCSRAAHERIHEKLKPFVCPECSIVFQTWSGERDSDRETLWKGKDGKQHFDFFQSFKVMFRRRAYTRPAFCQSHAAYASAKTLRTSPQPQFSNKTSSPTCSNRTPRCFSSARAAPKPSTPRLRYTRTGTNIYGDACARGSDRIEADFSLLYKAPWLPFDEGGNLFTAMPSNARSAVCLSRPRPRGEHTFSFSTGSRLLRPQTFVQIHGESIDFSTLNALRPCHVKTPVWRYLKKG